MSEKKPLCWSPEVAKPNLWALVDFAEIADKHGLTWVPIVAGPQNTLLAVARVLRPPLEASRFQPSITPGYAYDTDGRIFTFHPQRDGRALIVARDCPPEGVPADDIDQVWFTVTVETAIDNLKTDPEGYTAWSTARQTSGIIPPAPEA